jgi:hypothetical protein
MSNVILSSIFSSLNFKVDKNSLPKSNQKAIVPVVGKYQGIEKIKEHKSQRKNIDIFYPIQSNNDLL